MLHPKPLYLACPTLSHSHVRVSPDMLFRGYSSHPNRKFIENGRVRLTVIIQLGIQTWEPPPPFCGNPPTPHVGRDRGWIWRWGILTITLVYLATWATKTWPGSLFDPCLLSGREGVRCYSPCPHPILQQASGQKLKTEVNCFFLHLVYLLHEHIGKCTDKKENKIFLIYK